MISSKLPVSLVAAVALSGLPRTNCYDAVPDEFAVQVAELSSMANEAPSSAVFALVACAVTILCLGMLLGCWMARC